jgi:hypothetical protein
MNAAASCCPRAHHLGKHREKWKEITPVYIATSFKLEKGGVAREHSF